MEDKKLKIHWVSQDNMSTAYANALGYNSHNASLKKACEEYFDFDESAHIAITITPADKFKPVPGKKNILFCLAPHTRVVKANLEWVPVSDLKIGDEVIGFDEDLSLGHKNSFKKATVLGTSKFIGKGYRIKTSSSEVICSGNHMWVVRTKKKGRVWKRTDEIKPGDEICSWRSPWESLKDYDAGWLSGFLDGEGHVSNTGNGNCVGFSQNEGPVLSRAISILNKFGMTYNSNKAHSTKYPENTCYGVQIHNGVVALGRLRPTRLIEKSHLMWEGQRSWSHKHNPKCTVISVEEIGDCELVGTMTSTGTLIAEGMLSHNTMWECLDVPACYLPGLNSADLIVVPCEFCREVFAPVTNKPIVVCHEGADPDVFQFKERTVPDQSKGERFRYLWLGAPNPRKGYFSVLELVKVFERFSNVEIYFKTTANKKLAFSDLCKVILMYFKKREWKKLKATATRYLNPRIDQALIVHGRHKNIIFDSRKLSQQELVDLYHSAHCFIAPHCGEGWGLTLTEAMATGCPSVASHSTGVLDFFDSEVGYPVKCATDPVDLQNYNIKARVFVPDTKDFFEKVLHVYRNYKEALKKGRKASYRIRTNFTWKKAAKRMAQIIESHYYEREGNGNLPIQESADRGDHGARLEHCEV